MSQGSFMSIGGRALLVSLVLSFGFASLAPASDPGAQARLAQFSERVEAAYASHREPLAGPVFSDQAARLSGANAAGRHRLTEAWAKSAALEGLFGIAISSAMLQAELDRMGRETLQPERLRELFGALDNDPEAAAEILARPLVADRLLRLAYASDKSLHEKARTQVSRVLRDLSLGRGWPVGVGRLAKFVVSTKADAAGVPAEPRWDWEGRRVLSEEAWRERSSVWPAPGAPPRMEESADGFAVTRVRKGSDGLVEIEVLTVAKKSFDEWWAEIRPTFLGKPVGERAAFSYRMPTITQAATCGTLGSLQGQPSPRRGASAVWTGTEMIFYGGETLYSDARGSGGRFDPATGAYRRLPTGPGNFYQAWESVAVWTGTQVVIFLSGAYFGEQPLEGAAYDPASDTWASVSQGAGCLPSMSNVCAVWSGQEVLVWGAALSPHGGYIAVGARWNPATNTWRSLSAVGAPSPRSDFACVWTGSEMIVFGGTSLVGWDPAYLTGARYSPRTDTWTPTSVQSSTPESRQGFSAVWTGTELIVWGGTTSRHSYDKTGGRYNPATDSWSATTLMDAPAGRQRHSAVWTGNDMVIWGGVNRGPTGSGTEEGLDSGCRYDPVLDRWTPTPTDRFCPSGRKDHVALWTGTAMLVWSGLNYVGDYFNRLGDGGLLAEDGWSPLMLGAADTGRTTSTVGVWTGAELIVWGGQGWCYNYLDTGAVYDPATGSWRPTAKDWNTPSPRYDCTAVWTGKEMVVWGGMELQPWPYNPVPTWTGGRYDPALDRWEATYTGPGTPLPRYGQAAVWAGDKMIVWGGQGDWNAFLNTGGLYDPVLDRWTAMRTEGACPSPRSATAAAWTGSEMILWGGYIMDPRGQDVLLGDGGRFSPSTGRWAALPTGAGSPGPRCASAAVWTGDSVVVWGGSEPSSPTRGTGARFNPGTGSWSPITTSGACPLARSSPTTVWTGARLLIWGGGVWQASNASGAFYDPDADAWEVAPSAGGSIWSNPAYIGGGRSPLLLFSGGELAGYTLSPCLSARALASPDAAAGALTAKFQGFVSGGQEPYAYDWDFGDGSIHGSGEVAHHTYADPGAHSYNLTVTDAAGGSASQSKTVEVQPPPTISAVKTLANPFRLQVNGSHFKSGARVDIEGTPAPTTEFTSSTQLQAGGGKALKALLPKGTTVTVRVTNPDGLQATLPFTR